ncbi:MAG TPA: AMP-binding protein, partial [Candidatus Dormibacteraeota bacterium]|nr:AMP-binding protein [Candidatus Dormibacteraeota bacterium]
MSPDPAMAAGVRPLHELFVEQRRRGAERPAVVTSTSSVTYAELDAWSIRIAEALRAAPVAPGELVGVAVERGPALVASLLGVLRSGCAYVPLEPGHPAERVGRILDQAAPRIVLVSPSTGDQPVWSPYPVLEVPDRVPLGAGPAVGGAPARVRAEDPAYVAFTSGSTGAPKGVVCCHDGVVTYLAALIDAWSIGPGDRVLAVTSIAFDPSVRDIFGPLLAGATIVMASADETTDPSALADLMERERVTGCVSMVPRLLESLVDECEAAPRRLVFRLLLTCGDVLAAATAGRARRVLGCELGNQYGPTECTMVATSHRVAAEDLRDGAVPIGRPVGGAVVHVVDGWGELAPVGVLGELAIGGSGLARGYLGQPG